MKKIISLLLAAALLMSCGNALACTGFYVGKDASADGTYMIGHTVDSSNTTQGAVIAVPGVYDEPGRFFVVSDSVQFPLPDSTWA